ncbi:MAG: MATE family efflux transporter [candidate division Zixibacteria bacterium]|nr:MATE family efflux transporter [candidate division Zixibacteria bacterium]
MADVYEKQNKHKVDYTEGSIIQSILKMGTPSMIGFLAGHIYHMVDMLWVSRLPESETAVAAITIFSNVAWVFFSINMLIGPGSVAIISRRYGEKKYDAAETAIKETYLLKFIFGSIIGVLGYFFVEDIVYFAGARGETIGLAAQYGRILFLGMGFSLCTYSVYTALRGVANPNLAMGLMLGSTILNIILDPLLIFGYWGFPQLGVVGAAIASVTSYTLTLLIGIALFFTNKTNIRLHLRSKVPMSLATMGKIIKIGVPAWFGSLSFSGARLAVMPMVAIFGNSVIAAYGVGMTIAAIGIAILIGIGLGLGSLIGHNLGAGKKERAKKTADQAILLSVGIMLAVSAIIAYFARPIMQIYFDNPETVQVGVNLLQIMAIGFPFTGIYLMLEQVYGGVGLNTPAMVVSVGHSWVLEIPIIYILTQVLHYNQNSVWWTITGATFVSAIGFYWYYRKGQWLEAKV